MPDIDTLATAVYTRVDDFLSANPYFMPERPAAGYQPLLSDAELVTLAVMQPILRFDNESRWIRYASKHLKHLFPYIPKQPGYNKRLRKNQELLETINFVFATEVDVYHDDLWLIDSTPVECGRSRTTTKQSNVNGWASYGYCASHSRWFWGLRLHMVATPSGLPITWALTNPKIDEREIAADLIDMTHKYPSVIIADKGYNGEKLETKLNDHGIDLIRPSKKAEPVREGNQFLKPFRQIIESVFATFKSQLGLENHGGRTWQGVSARVTQRICALTAVMWHNQETGQPTLRSLTAYDH